MAEQRATTRSNGQGWLRYVFPVGGYALAQIPFLLVAGNVFLERGAESWWWLLPDPVMFLCVFVPAAVPAVVVGAVDGVARLPRRAAWTAAFRAFASLLVAVLGLFAALVGGIFLALNNSNLDASIGPLPLGTYVGALLGMEAVLAVSWGVAVATRRFFERRRAGRARGGRR